MSFFINKQTIHTTWRHEDGRDDYVSSVPLRILISFQNEKKTSELSDRRSFRKQRVINRRRYQRYMSWKKFKECHDAERKKNKYITIDVSLNAVDALRAHGVTRSKYDVHLYHPKIFQWSQRNLFNPPVFCLRVLQYLNRYVHLLTSWRANVDILTSVVLWRFTTRVSWRVFSGNLSECSQSFLGGRLNFFASLSWPKSRTLALRILSVSLRIVAASLRAVYGFSLSSRIST